MKKNWVLTSLLMAFFVVLQAREIIITIQVNQASSQQITFSYLKDALKGERKMYVLELDEKGEATAALEVGDEALLEVSYKNEFFEVWIKEATRFSIRFQGEQLVRTIEFDGDNASTNNLLKDFCNTYGWDTPDNIKLQRGLWECKLPRPWWELARTGNQQDYLKALEKAISGQRELLNTATKQLSPAAFEFLEKRLLLQNELIKMVYFISNEKQQSLGLLQEIAATWSPVDAFKVTKDELLFRSYYLNHLVTFVCYKYVLGDSKETNEVFAFYDLIQRHIKGDSKDYMLAQMFLAAHAKALPSLAEQQFAFYKNSSPPKSYIEWIETVYGGTLAAPKPDGFAPIFNLPDAEEKLFSLAQFKGKVVYVSFWATWCQPCLVGFKKTEFVRNQLEDMGVVLINISLDEDQETWQNTVARVPMPGINLFGGNEPTLQIMYDLSRLPAYYIVGKDGKFAYLSDDTNRDILDEFNKLINK